MPYYFPLKHNFGPDESQRAAQNLLALRRQLRAEIPARTVNDTLLLATWNLRDFDSNKFKHGPRLKESFFYIAEIISAFDMVALQEINEDLSALNKVLRILGPDWDYITTDKTEGASGNNERMTFVYDTRKVRFLKIAGEVVLPLKQLVSDERQFARTPFLVAFQSGWFKFMICTVHIYFGSASGEQLQRRIAEIEAITKFLSKRADDEAANYILLGDFNIVSPEHQTMQALKKHGFLLPEGLSASNIHLDKHYDQIAFKSREGQVQFSGNSGVFNPYLTLFSESDRQIYYPLMTNKDNLELDAASQPLDNESNQKYYLNTWRTFQISDHLPMWVELRIDFAEQYLQEFVMPSFAYQPEHPLSFAMPELDNL
ncbi:MAG: endonuclease/exonuclease/phosphatase family protein [Anaerolineales bacterium]|nr:MAG: endonuclease/exonuclease/phosphatase family protein [Anaerolineales bacterium]